MAIPLLSGEPARRVFVIPLVLIPTVKRTQSWSYTTGGVVVPVELLKQRNEQVIAWFGGTIYVYDDGGVGEAKPVFYAQDTRRHVELDGLTIRSDVTNRQSFITGPLDVTRLIPPSKMIGIRACARSVRDGLQVSFFHLALTFWVQ